MFCRRITPSGRPLPQECLDVIEHFFAEFEEKLAGVPRKLIFVGDQSPVRLDAPRMFNI